MIQWAVLLDLYLNVTLVIIGVHCRSRMRRGCGNIKRKLHLLKKKMGENVITNCHRPSQLHTTNGRGKGLPVEESRRWLERCYSDVRNQETPIM